MNLGDILTLYEYNNWANRRLLAASAHVSQAQWVARSDHSFGSLRGTLVHILDGERAWRLLYQEQTLSGFGELQAEAFTTLHALEQRWGEETRLMRTYLGQLSDADLTSMVRYTLDTGQRRERLLWHCLFHVANHGTQHRGEAATLLTAYGASPGDMDFTAFLNEQVA